VTEALMRAHRDDVDWDLNQIAAHYLAGGDPRIVLEAASVLKAAEVPIDVPTLAAADLAQLDLIGLAAEFVGNHDVGTAAEFRRLVGEAAQALSAARQASGE
jgi:uncharacterized protein YqfA (UPF0365 family)